MKDALIFAGQSLEIQFQMSRPLTDFMATLHKNGLEEKKLSNYARVGAAALDLAAATASERQVFSSGRRDPVRAPPSP